MFQPPLRFSRSTGHPARVSKDVPNRPPYVAFVGWAYSRNQASAPLVLDGLWAPNFGNGASSGPTNVLYFTAGPDDEQHGLLGSIAVVPLPAAAWSGLVLSAGLLAVRVVRRRQPA